MSSPTLSSLKTLVRHLLRCKSTLLKKVPASARRMGDLGKAEEVNVVAVCQMTSTEDKTANMKTVSWLIERAAKLGAKVCIDLFSAWI